MHSFLFQATALASIITATFAQIDPSTVPIATRDYWCQSQITQCPLICTQENSGSAATLANDCQSQTLTYDCVCGNGLTPNASEYSQTIPYFVCTQANLNCQANCGLNNNACAAACVQDHPCGAQNPTRVNATTITSTSTSNGAAQSTASDGSVVYNGFGGAATTTAATSSHKNSAAAVRIVGLGEIYGLGVVTAGIFAGFTLLL